MDIVPAGRGRKRINPYICTWQPHYAWDACLTTNRAHIDIT
jgi:hypothetical protein